MCEKIIVKLFSSRRRNTRFDCDWSSDVCSSDIAIYVERRNAVFPWTDAATIDADVVHVAAAVGGRIIDIPVSENTLVSKGDLLFQIDPVPYRLAVAQAESDLAIAEASLETQQRVLSTQRSAAKVAAEQVQRAQTNLELAK